MPGLGDCKANDCFPGFCASILPPASMTQIALLLKIVLPLLLTMTDAPAPFFSTAASFASKLFLAPTQILSLRNLRWLGVVDRLNHD